MLSYGVLRLILSFPLQTTKGVICEQKTNVPHAVRIDLIVASRTEYTSLKDAFI